MNKKEKALEWAKQFETSKCWLTHIQTNKTGSHKTQLEYAYRLSRFCDWAKKNLPNLLADGWRFVAALSSGKCVVSNEV